MVKFYYLLTVVVAVMGVYATYLSIRRHKSAKVWLAIIVAAIFLISLFQYLRELNSHENDTAQDELLQQINSKLTSIDEPQKAYLLSLSNELLVYIYNSIKNKPSFVDTNSNTFNQTLKSQYEEQILADYQRLFSIRIHSAVQKLNGGTSKEGILQAFSRQPHKLSDIYEIALKLRQMSGNSLDEKRLEIRDLIAEKLRIYEQNGVENPAYTGSVEGMSTIQSIRTPDNLVEQPTPTVPSSQMTDRPLTIFMAKYDDEFNVIWATRPVLKDGKTITENITEQVRRGLIVGEAKGLYAIPGGGFIVPFEQRSMGGTRY